MSDSPTERKLGTLLCVIFATHFISILYGIYGGAFIYKLGQSFFSIGNIILSLPIIISAFLISSNPQISSTRNSRIFSWIFFGLQTFSLFNWLCYLIFDNNIPGCIGDTSQILFPIIYAASTILFYVNLRMWKPIMIVGCFSAIPSIINGLLIYQIAGKDFSEDLMTIYNAIGSISIISAVLYLASLILSIIWTIKKPKTPSAQTNPIDLI